MISNIIINRLLSTQKKYSIHFLPSRPFVVLHPLLYRGQGQAEALSVLTELSQLARRYITDLKWILTVQSNPGEQM